MDIVLVLNGDHMVAGWIQDINVNWSDEFNLHALSHFKWLSWLMVPGFSEVLYVTFKIFILVIRTEDQKITVMSVIFVLMPVTFEITFLINGVVLGF